MLRPPSTPQYRYDETLIVPTGLPYGRKLNTDGQLRRSVELGTILSVTPESQPDHFKVSVNPQRMLSHYLLL